MQLKPRSTRTIALLTGGIIAATTLFQPAPAQAADKSKNLKYGAIGLGVLGAYLLTKGKTVGGVAAVAGGLYAYKKGRNAQDDCDPRDRGHDNRDHGNGGYNNGGYSNSGYGNGSYNNGGHGNGGYENGHNYGGGYSTGGGYGNGGYGNYDSQYRSNADYRDNRGQDRDQRDDRQKSDRRDDRRGDQRDNRGDNYDLSPYLR